MNTKHDDTPLVRLAEEVVDGICIGQMAALATLRAEMAALSVMMSTLPQPAGNATTSGNPGARATVLDPEDNDFDNMPV